MKTILCAAMLLTAFSCAVAGPSDVQTGPKLETRKPPEQAEDDLPTEIEVPPPRKGVILHAEKHPNPPLEERKAVLAAVEAGATVEYDGADRVRSITDCDRASNADLKLFAALPHLEVLVLNSPDVTDAGLIPLVKAKALRYLKLANTGVTDAGMTSIGQMATLVSLGLGSPGITGAGMARLRDLKRLENMNIEGSAIGDDGMRAIAEIGSLRRLRMGGGWTTWKGFAELARSKSLVYLFVCRALTDDDMLGIGQLTHLEELRAGFPELTDEGLRRMKDMKRLKSLCLFVTKTSDAGMAYVGDMTGLERLELNHRIGDAGIAKLGSLKNLKRLNLSDTKVTDAGLATLTALHELRSLGLGYTHVTAAGVAQLRNMKHLEIGLDYTDVSMEDIGKLNKMGIQASRSPRTNPRWNDESAR